MLVLLSCLNLNSVVLTLTMTGPDYYSRDVDITDTNKRKSSRHLVIRYAKRRNQTKTSSKR